MDRGDLVHTDERRARLVLEASLATLAGAGWRVLPGVRRSASALGDDAVLVGPGGVFVVCLVPSSGPVSVSGGVLRENGRNRQRVVSSVVRAGEQLREQVPGLGAPVVTPVVCLARDDRVVGWADGAMVSASSNLATFLTARPTALDDDEVERLAGLVRRAGLGLRGGSGGLRGQARPAAVLALFVVAAAAFVQLDLPDRPDAPRGPVVERLLGSDAGL